MIMFWKKKTEQRLKNEDRTSNGITRRWYISYHSRTDTGMVRDHNEDAIGCMNFNNRSLPCLAIIADGMGGHNSGEIASRIAVESNSQMFYKYKDQNRSSLEKAFHVANDEIFRKAESNAIYEGMGTTCSALVIDQEQAFYAHVGDSRIYLHREGQLRQLTEDQTLVHKMIRAGTLRPEDARNHPNSNILWQAMGTKPTLEIENPDKIQLKKNDRFLLCSDGLTDLVQDIELRHIMEMSSLSMITNCLIALANDKGGIDNISVIVIQIDELNADYEERITRDLSKIGIITSKF